MAVSLKVKAAKSAKPVNATTMKVDRIVELKKAIDAVAPLAKEYADLTAELRKQAMTQDPRQVVLFQGTDHDVVFSEAARVRKLGDMKEIKKALGNEVFFEVAKVTLGDIDKYLTPEEISTLVTVEDGPRKIDIVEK